MFTHLCRWLLKISGWQIQGLLPSQAKYIVIVAPHTSNWDFIIGVLARGALNTRIHFLGKHQLFIPPWGWFFRAIGGSPVDRRKNNNLVDAAVQLFATQSDYKLALAPEGTRSPVTRWKCGFYHIASKAQVPIVRVGLDFARKAVVIQPPLQPREIEQDMAEILSFYRSIKGRHPKTIPDYTPDNRR
ncbi:lysophospholipid acyltransferase family protein [Shewanella sp. FJAT-51649]|uniref:lysophospholipid acyltransferase family protein n=1 Tax=Shewanella sp. FJAT-51649 TaxID=2864210 RepID=UPI001C65ABDF|nr:lysophospholipid acyltransferase family protein [Shewanella sp. FJAT-51649]QYJ71580.1 lysophospholipid acyltransferase family protein [Shewanella sp. FJAT-51649]